MSGEIGLSPERLIQLGQVESITGLNRRRLYLLVRLGLFPPQIKSAGHASQWREADVKAWAGSRSAGTARLVPDRQAASS